MSEAETMRALYEALRDLVNRYDELRKLTQRPLQFQNEMERARAALALVSTPATISAARRWRRS